MSRSHTHVSRAVHNSAWLLLERGITLGLHFIVGILIARYLGPEAFGSLSYAIAFVSLLAVIPYLGLASTVVQELVNDQGGQSEIIGTVVWAKMAAAVAAIALGILVATLVVDEPRDRMLILLASFSILFDVGAAIRLLFEARTDVRQVALVSIGATATASLARIVAVIAMAPLWVFAALITAQSALAAAGYLVAYRRAHRGKKFPFRWERAKQLLGKSWPLIVSSGAAVLYLKIDQVMLGQMLGMSAVGTYEVAARLSEVWYFLPTAVAASIFPRLVELRSSDPDRYRRRIKESLRYLFWLSLVIAVPVSLAAPFLVVLFFGEPFREAGAILAIHVWACPAVFMGMAIEKWFVAENLLKYLIARQLVAAALNVGLNLLLIPLYGGVGAAVATVISYTFAYYFSCFTSRRTAVAGRWMTEAIVWPLIQLFRQGRAGSTSH